MRASNKPPTPKMGNKRNACIQQQSGHTRKLPGESSTISQYEGMTSSPMGGRIIDVQGFGKIRGGLFQWRPFHQAVANLYASRILRDTQDLQHAPAMEIARVEDEIVGRKVVVGF